jgi:hypothetical protein
VSLAEAIVHLGPTLGGTMVRGPIYPRSPFTVHSTDSPVTLFSNSSNQSINQAMSCPHAPSLPFCCCVLIQVKAVLSRLRDDVEELLARSLPPHDRYEPHLNILVFLYIHTFQSNIITFYDASRIYTYDAYSSLSLSLSPRLVRDRGLCTAQSVDQRARLCATLARTPAGDSQTYNMCALV